MNFFGSKAREQLLGDLVRKDRYRLLGHLGKGRTSDITTCFDSRLNRIVAMKQLRKESAADEQQMRAFLNETKLISYLDHPGVVSIYDVFVDENGEPGYSMKLVKGNNLRWEFGSKTRSQLLSVFAKLCETLAYVHDRGVAHLDLNPDTIMVGQYGEVMITDWGNSRLYDDHPYREYLKLVRDPPPPPVDDRTGKDPACVLYFSPEHFSGDRDALGPSSDVFSMGVILYEMMSGATPFTGEDSATVAQNICQGVPPMLHEACPELPRMLSTICAKMLEKDPFTRYHSMHDVLVDIDRFNNSGQAFANRHYAAGEVIFREGEPGDFAFTILSGAVEVSKVADGEKKVLARLGRNEFVGELAIFTNEQRTATIMALEPTLIRIMDRGSVEQELQKLSPWVQNMITGLSKRFIRLNEQALQKDQD